MADNFEREFGWDDAIENDGPEYTLLPEGEVTFKVTGIERKRYSGGDKLPPCNMAELKVELIADDGKRAIVTERLYLHSRMEGKLCSFFTAIGQRKHGERLVPRWNAVVGSTGRCKIGVREYNGRQYNDIKSYIEPPEKPAPAVGGWQPGNF